MTVMTENDEKYRCLIPQLQEKEKNFNEKKSGPNPLDLLSILFKQSSCSHRVCIRILCLLVFFFFFFLI